MKLNVRKEMIKKDMDEMTKFHYGGTSPNNKHKNRNRRTKAMFKAAWNRELKRQFDEEIAEVGNLKIA